MKINAHALPFFYSPNHIIFVVAIWIFVLIISAPRWQIYSNVLYHLRTIWSGQFPNSLKDGSSGDLPATYWLVLLSITLASLACLANWLARWLQSGRLAADPGGRIGFVALPPNPRHCLRFFTHRGEQGRERFHRRIPGEI